jgi:hypothetical protein
MAADEGRVLKSTNKNSKGTNTAVTNTNERRIMNLLFGHKDISVPYKGEADYKSTDPGWLRIRQQSQLGGSMALNEARHSRRRVN